MPAITGGLVSVEDGTKSDQEYAPPRKVRVELRFDVPPEFSGDPSEIVAKVGQLANNQVAALLGYGDAAPSSGMGSTTVLKVHEPGSPGALAVTQADAPKRTRRSKEQIAADEAAAKAATQAATDPLAGMGATAAPAAATAVDPLAFLSTPAVETPKEITDADLNAAVQKKLTTFNNPARLRSFIQSDWAVPTLAEIPQEKRADFVKGLEALA